MTDLTDDALDRIEQAFRTCQADHAACKHEISGLHLVQDLGPALVKEVRKLRGSFGELETLPGGLTARRIAEELRRKEAVKPPPEGKRKK